MSSDLDAFAELWKRRIEKDLAPFADPNTEVQVDRAGRVLSATWLRRGQQSGATFSINVETGVRVTAASQDLSYSSFLASEQMGDMQLLARMTLQSAQKGVFVETKGECKSYSIDGPATQVLSKVLTITADEPATRVLMVTGDAGSGKTQVLQKLVRDQADQYLRGKSPYLILYVNAQGRALARLYDALAAELNYLRVLLPVSAVAVLVRAGLIVPVIDGFDELLGVGGYDDAFSSLAGFISELDGQGAIIASARSAYYEQEFVARANSVSALGAHVWSQTPITIRAWTREEVSQYVKDRAVEARLSSEESSSLLSKVETAFAGKNSALEQKPLFVAKVVDLLLDGLEIGAGESLLESMVDIYLDRECNKKILDKRGGPLISVPQLRSLLTELAEEMWNQETRELDLQSVRYVAEYVLSAERLSAEALQVVLERMPYMAFLTRGSRPGGAAFEHETFFGYFLAHRFATLLSKSTGIPAATLGRSSVSSDLAANAVDVLQGIEPLAHSNVILESLALACSQPHPRQAQIRDNSGTIVAELLRVRTASNSNLLFRNLTFSGVDFGATIVRNSTFESCQFRRSILSRSKFLTCNTSGTIFAEITVDPTYTRLELSGLDVEADVVGIVSIEDSGDLHTYFGPAEVRRVLQSIGAIPITAAKSVAAYQVNPVVLGLLERFMREYRKSNPVCTSNDFMRPVFEDDRWPRIQELLLRNRVVTSETRATKGSAGKTFLRRQVLPEEVLAGESKSAKVPDSVASFWKELESTFPKDSK